MQDGPAGSGHNGAVHISAKADYAVRALLVLAASDGRPISGAAIAESQGMPVKFVENTLVELRRTGLIMSRRGKAGGFMLGKPAAHITIADVVRAVDGPLADVRGERPEATNYTGPAKELQTVWVAVRANVRSVLEQVTLADVADGRIPRRIQKLTESPDAWKPH